MKKIVFFIMMLLTLMAACKKNEVINNKIESMTFESDTYTLEEGDDLSLVSRLTILPETIGDTVTVQWSVENPEVATISAYGSLEALREGSTAVTASAMGVKATCEIVVEPLKIKEFNIPSELTVYVNEPTEIEISDLSPKKAPLYRIKWESTDDDVMPKLEDNKKWVLTTDKVGTYTLKATSGNLEARTCEVTVKIRPITKFNLSKTATSLIVGQVDTLSLTIEPENASYTDYEWRSTNNNVATVDKNGIVTAVGAGEATITATHYPVNESDALKEAACVVTVTKTPPVTDFSVEDNYVEIVKTKAGFVKITSVLPEGASAGTLKWTISDPSIAVIKGGTVDGMSKQINGLKIGTTELTISSSTGFSKNVTIEVLPLDPVKVNWQFSDVCVWDGTELTLPKPTIEPADADYREVYYAIGSSIHTYEFNEPLKVTMDKIDYSSDYISVHAVAVTHDGELVKSSDKKIVVIPTTYEETKGFENATTVFYGTFGMSYNYRTFNYDNYTIKPKINSYVNLMLSTTGSYAAVKLNSTNSRVYYLKTPKLSYDNIMKQVKEYESTLKYSIKVTDGLGVTKEIQAPTITFHSSFLGLAYNYSGKNAFNINMNGAGDNVRLWLDDFAKGDGEGNIVQVSDSPTTAQAISLYVYNKKGYVDALSTEAAVSWPANSYSPCYVGQEAATVLGVEAYKVIFKK